MKTRVALMLAAVGGLAAAANAQFSPNPTTTYTVSWIEVTSANVPVANPNNILEPGESARFTISMALTPGTGTPVTYPASLVQGGAGAGVLRGYMGGVFGINATGGSGAGAWANRAIQGVFVQGAIPSQAGVVANSGATLNNIAPQLLGVVAEELPEVDSGALFVGRWTPTDYSARTLTWQMIANTLNTSNASAYARDNNSVWNGDPTDPTNVAYAPAIATTAHVFGSVTVPIVPAPSSLALLGLGGLVAARRRR